MLERFMLQCGEYENIAKNQKNRLVRIFEKLKSN